jgi:hypothetical protein
MEQSAAKIVRTDDHKEQHVDARWDGAKARLRSHIFRIWTAAAFLAGYVYAWVYVPEALTWWKRSTETAIESICGMLPYPWGDRLEATIGNFGLWVQITFGILAFRILIWLLWAAMRAAHRLRNRTPQPSQPV